MMKQIVPAIESVKKICGEQSIKADAAYRECLHVLHWSVGEGELLYHTLTGELLLVSKDEWQHRLRDDEIRLTLIKRRFLVPKDFNELLYADQVNHLMSLMQKKSTALRSFTILTTLDCNARCFYCYELGGARQVMSEQTAYDTADYICRVSDGQEISLNWFGGEPLFNVRVIDIITEELRRRGVAYHAKMISNGYLFDPETARRAKELWNLKQVQITLDGTEEIYNKTKAYIYSEGSAYQRVLNNIGTLLDQGIKVNIRLNMNVDNAENLSELAQELRQRFPDRPGLNVYVAMLHEYGRQRVGTFDDPNAGLEKYRELVEKLTAFGLRRQQPLSRRTKLNSCMADRDDCVMILPNGKLGKCEHDCEKDLVGDIYSDTWDEAVQRAWKKKLFDLKCEKCAIYPQCRRLEKCATYKDGCVDILRIIAIENIRQSVLETYERYRNGHAGSQGSTDENEEELC